MIAQPKHYADATIEPVEVWEACLHTTTDPVAAALRALVLKHSMRAGAKGPEIEDARKCADYALRWVKRLESQAPRYRVEYRSPFDGWVTTYHGGGLTWEQADAVLAESRRKGQHESYRLVEDAEGGAA